MASILIRILSFLPGGLAGLCVSIMAAGQSVSNATTPLRETTLTQRTDTNQVKTSDTALTGMGVFGNTLAIHGHDTITVRGDLVLHVATIGGPGTLQLRDTRPRRIIARHSTVTNLYLANPTQVTLHGELRVRQSLSVERGTFDTRAGTLRLADTACVRLRGGGKILRATTENGIAWARFPTSEDLTAGPMWATRPPHLVLPLAQPATQLVGFTHPRLPKHQPWVTNWSPPPETDGGNNRSHLN